MLLLSLQKHVAVFYAGFNRWTETKWGLVFWRIVRPILSVTFWIISTFMPFSVIKVSFILLFVLLALPDWLGILKPLLVYFAKLTGITRFKSGELLCLKTKFCQKEYGIPIPTTLYSVELKNENDAMVAAWDTITNGEYIPRAKLICQPCFNTDVFLALGKEKIGKNPFWIKFEPFKEKSPKIKVLYNNRIYWANPKHFKKLKPKK